MSYLSEQIKDIDYDLLDDIDAASRVYRHLGRMLDRGTIKDFAQFDEKLLKGVNKYYMDNIDRLGEYFYFKVFI